MENHAQENAPASQTNVQPVEMAEDAASILAKAREQGLLLMPEDAEQELRDALAIHARLSDET